MTPLEPLGVGAEREFEDFRSEIPGLGHQTLDEPEMRILAGGDEGSRGAQGDEENPGQHRRSIPSGPAAGFPDDFETTVVRTQIETTY